VWYEVLIEYHVVACGWSQHGCGVSRKPRRLCWPPPTLVCVCVCGMSCGYSTMLWPVGGHNMSVAQAVSVLAFPESGVCVVCVCSVCVCVCVCGVCVTIVYTGICIC